MNDLKEKYHESRNKILEQLEYLKEQTARQQPINQEILTQLLEEYKVQESCFAQIKEKIKNYPFERESVYSFQEYVTTLEMVEQNQQKIEVIQRFLSVEGSTATLDSELKPFQKKAETLSHSLLESQTLSTPQEEDFSMCQKFLYMMEHKELEEQEEEVLLDEIEDFFGKKITRGLCGHKFSCEKMKNLPVHTSGKEEIKKSMAKSIEKSAPLTSQIHPSSQEERDALQKTCETKPKKANVTNFLKDTYSLDLRISLPFLYFFQTLISLRQCLDMINKFVSLDSEMEEAVENKCHHILEQAVTRGILARFDSDGALPPLYALTPYTIECMEKESVKRPTSKYKKIPWSLKYWISKKGEDTKGKTIESLTLEEGKLWYHQAELLIQFFIKTEENITFVMEQSTNIQKNKDGYAMLIESSDGKIYTAYLLGENDPITRDSIIVTHQKNYKLPNHSEYLLFQMKEDTIYYYEYQCNTWIEFDAEEEDDLSDLIDDVIDQTYSKEDDLFDTDEDTDLSMLEDKDIFDLDEEENTSVYPEEVEKPSVTTVDSVHPTALPRQKPSLPSEEEFLSKIEELLAMQPAVEIDQSSVHHYHHLLNALLLSYTASLVEGYTRCEEKFKKLLTATQVPWLKPSYFSELEFTKEEEAESFATLCFDILIPHKVQDYNIKTVAYATLKNFEEIYPHFTFLKPFFNLVCEAIKSKALVKKGFSKELVFTMQESKTQKNELNSFKERAKVLIPAPNIPKHIKGIDEFKTILFGSEGNLQSALELIETPSSENISLLKEVIQVYCDFNNEEYVISRVKLNAEIDRCWKEAAQKVGTGVIRLSFGPRDKALKELLKRVELMIEFVGLEVDDSLDDNDYSKVKEERRKLLEEIQVVLPQLQTMDTTYKPAIISFALQHMASHIRGINLLAVPFPHLLQTGIIPLEENGTPYFNPEFSFFRGYEPWYCVQTHMEKESQCSFEKAICAVDDENDPLFDNLYLKDFISRYCTEFKNLPPVDEGDKIRCQNSSKKRTEITRDSVILAFTYGRIEEREKEMICEMIDEYHDIFCQLNAFGCWNQFLSSISIHLDFYSKSNEEVLLDAIDCERKNNPDCSFVVLEEAENLIKNSKNLAVAEEYLNRFKSGEYNLPEYDNMMLSPQYLCHFLSAEIYQPLHQKCRENRTNGMNKLASDFAETKDKRSMLAKRYPTAHKLEEWQSKNFKSTRNLLEHWPSGQGNAKSIDIHEIFKEIGFEVDGVTKNPNDLDCFTINLKKAPLDKADYPHPISSLGTKTKPNMNVLLLFGKHTPSTLLEKISKRSFGPLTFVLLDDSLTESDRRTLVELYRKENSTHNSFLLLDRVLLLHLALQPDNRLRIFLQCTLPFTFYQPFVDGQGGSSDEMFCGREKELQDIINPNGAVILYGGRQLGKTALLERGISLCHKPQTKRYGVYCTLPKCGKDETITESLVVEYILTACERKDILFSPCATIKELCDQIFNKFKTQEFASFHLFVDESDKFLESISGDNYRQIQPLVELRRETGNDFKFVLAGLHDVSRASRAVKENGLFGQIGTLCIKPLKPQEALLLLSRPLQYLGFSIDKIEHLETILANTNYYPGILQLFGYHLVGGLSEEYSKHYSPSKMNPPFALSDAQLGSVMNSKNLIQSIKEKMLLSLKLDERYHMLARCIAAEYHFKQGDVLRSEGVYYKEIMDTVELFDIICLKKISEEDCLVLLSEMRDMGILTEIKENCYGLRRKAFLGIIGETESQIESDINREQERLV